MAHPRRAVLFDVDGTLVDSTYHHALAWRRAFARAGLPAPLWRIHRAIGMGGDKLVAEVTDERVEDDHGDDLRAAWREEYLPLRQEVTPLPGAAELVKQLSDTGYLVALASSGDPQFAQEAVELLGIGGCVDVLTTSEDVERSKPAPDLVGATLERLGVVSAAVMIGDTPYDVEAAARAGIGCLTLRSGGYSSAELTEAGATLVVDAPRDLLDADWESYLRSPG